MLPPNLNTAAKRTAAKVAGQILSDFCACADLRTFARMEDAITYEVRAYVEYTLYGMNRQAATHRLAAENLLKKAAKYGSTPPNEAP